MVDASIIIYIVRCVIASKHMFIQEYFKETACLLSFHMDYNVQDVASL